jgi:DNA-binding LytR/AlgR family response regulator
LIVGGDGEAPPPLDVVPEPAHGGATGEHHWSPQIVGEKSGRIYFLDAHEVEYVASAGNYVVTHIGASEFLTRATLKSMSEQLLPLGFVQIERSLLVNLRRVAYVERHLRGQFCFVMRGGARLVSSRERGASLRAFLLGPVSP